MKSFLLGVVAAILLAVGAATVLNLEVQETAERAGTTEGVRL